MILAVGTCANTILANGDAMAAAWGWRGGFHNLVCLKSIKLYETKWARKIFIVSYTFQNKSIETGRKGMNRILIWVLYQFLFGCSFHIRCERNILKSGTGSFLVIWVKPKAPHSSMGSMYPSDYSILEWLANSGCCHGIWETIGRK